MRSLLRKIFALVFISASVFLFTALISYDPFDPSFNVITEDTKIRNLAGKYGSYIADSLLKIFGYASYILPLLFGIWGCKLLFGRVKLSFGAFFLLPLTLISFAASFSLFDNIIASKIIQSNGGYIGSFLYKSARENIGVHFYGFIAVAFAISSFIVISGLNRANWFFIGKICLIILILSQKFVAILLRAIKFLLYLPARFKKKYDIKPTEGAILKAKIEENLEKQATKKAFFQLKSKFNTKNNKASNKVNFGANKSGKNLQNDGYPDWQSKSEVEFEASSGHFILPVLSYLSLPQKSKNSLTARELEENQENLSAVLRDFGVHGQMLEILPGPVVTLYALEPAAGTKSSRVIGLADDIARSMSALSTRIAVMPGRNALGIELPNHKRETVYLREIFATEDFQNISCKLPLALGKDIGGNPVIIDLASMPHLLVAGTTGSGKSVGINAMILSLLYRYTPKECKFIMIDPKMLELSVYADIPHLLTPVVTEPKKAVVALKWVVREMEERYRAMSDMGVRNLDGYNNKIMQEKAKGEILYKEVHKGFDNETGEPIMEKIPLAEEKLPFIVVVVDEMADLMLVSGKEIEGSIQRLAQMARAAGIHIILATQRPSVDVITGVIKANFPSRISFQVTSKIDSRTILGEQGAEQLLGMGDMLYMASGTKIKRVHGPFVSDDEVNKIAEHLRNQQAPEYVEEGTKDDEELALQNAGDDSGKDTLYKEAVKLVISEKKPSISYVQRSFKIGYNRAANIIEQMEKDGIVSEANHKGKREVLIE